MTNRIQKYGAVLIILVASLRVSTHAFAELQPSPIFGDEYQTELPAPPAFPLNFKNIDADNEESKSQKEEDRERFDPEKTQIGERIRQDAKWSTDYELDFPDWKPSGENDWDIDGEMIVMVILGTLGAILLVFLGLFLSKMKFKRKRKEENEGTESIIAHLESVTKNQAHEKLAINGDFDIAVHALLLDILRVIFRADPDMDRPSVTAREIRAAYEEPEIQTDLAPLIQVVEWSRFAERPATEEDYFDLVPRCERLNAIFQERVWRNKGTMEDTVP